MNYEIEIDTETITDAGFDRYLFRAFVESGGGGTADYSRVITADSIVGGIIGQEGVIYIGSTNIKLDGANKRIVIPGYAASISGDMEEELPDWEVVIGPRDASLIPKFLKEFVK